MNNPVISQVLSRIKDVLKTGKPWEEKNLHLPAWTIIESVLTIDGMAKDHTVECRGSDGFDTNRWQYYDWWQHFTHDGKKYTLSGSGYYGWLRFHLSDI